MTRIATPVAGFSGVVANVKFVDGVGETGNPTAVAYFKRHGYSIEDATPAPAKKAPAKKSAPKPSKK